MVVAGGWGWGMASDAVSVQEGGKSSADGYWSWLHSSVDVLTLMLGKIEARRRKG